MDQASTAGQSTLERYGLALTQLYASCGEGVSATAPSNASCINGSKAEQPHYRPHVPISNAARLPDFSYDNHTAMSENAPERDRGGVEEALPTEGMVDSQKMNMLLAHPVVVKAMCNPRLDEILARMLGICHPLAPIILFVCIMTLCVHTIMYFDLP